RTLLQEHVQAEQAGIPPPPSLMEPIVPVAPASTPPPPAAEANARPLLPVRVEVREPSRRSLSLTRSASSHSTSRRAPTDDAPSWLKGAAVDAPAVPSAAAAKLGVPFGAHIRARLKSNLDSRTVGDGLVEAVLLRPHVERGQAVLPSRTMLYGR